VLVEKESARILTGLQIMRIAATGRGLICCYTLPTLHIVKHRTLELGWNFTNSVHEDLIPKCTALAIPTQGRYPDSSPVLS